MDAKGPDVVKQFEGGVRSQREHLNRNIRDYNALYGDVLRLERRQNILGNIERIIIVSIGEVSDQVEFVYFDAVGEIVGTVAEVDTT